MTRSTLAEVLGPAMRDGYAVAGFVCLGWEDAQAFVVAAETEGMPVILQAGPGARKHTPLPVLGAMFRTLADAASVPVVLHLDHATDPDECEAAIDEGFTSVMIDGSRLPLEDNIALTASVVQMARRAGVSTEGEIGFVGYQDGASSLGTQPDEAAVFARESNVDAIAVSVGNVHLQEQAQAEIDLHRLNEIEKVCQRPLVLHGGSGIPRAVRSHLARTTNVCKFNIGTEVRQAFGQALRQALADDRQAYDRIALLSQTHEPLLNCARRIIRDLAEA